MTGSMDALLLAHAFALCLKVDDYATDTAILAADLKLGTMKSVHSRSRLRNSIDV